MKNNHFFLVAIVLLAMTFTFSCSNDNSDNPTTIEARTAGYCYSDFHSYKFCYKAYDGECYYGETFSNGCPSGYDSSPKGCIFPNPNNASGGCLMIVPFQVLGSTWLVTESECRSFASTTTIGDYNTFCFK